MRRLDNKRAHVFGGKAFQRLGFADVYEVAIGADLCTIEEAKERLKAVIRQMMDEGDVS